MTKNLTELLGILDALLNSEPHLTLPQVSQKLHTSRQRVENCLLQTKGITFRKLKQGKLVAKALALFSQNQRLSDKEVAFMLGYRSPEAFSRFIRNATGRTPSEIRNRDFKRKLGAQP